MLIIQSKHFLLHYVKIIRSPKEEIQLSLYAYINIKYESLIIICCDFYFVLVLDIR